MMMGMNGGHMGMRGGMMGMHGGAHHFLGLILLVGAIALGFYFWNRHRRHHHCDDAMETLRMRLAKSEITPEEYDTLKQKLQGK
ncbi:MAG TPA: SHOCT domain-containing protein [Symbiobacteriaceae bacterium]|nr:SHOCT domain-containing protein [Symbiobacteriaceae bacterium]